jgi:hypothetical protein
MDPIIALASGGRCSFLKLYRKGSQPAVQLRIDDAQGWFHYVDLHVFSASDGSLKVDDVQVFDRGKSFSRQLTDFDAANSPGRDLKLHGKYMEVCRRAVDLMVEGKAIDGWKLIESLPMEEKESKNIMRLRIQIGIAADPAAAGQLLAVFRKKWPDDPSIVFLEIVDCIERDDRRTAIGLIDEIGKLIGGDSHLLLFKLPLQVADGRFGDATQTLSELEQAYRVNASAVAETLDKRFLDSSEYKNWLNGRKSSAEAPR